MISFFSKFSSFVSNVNYIRALENILEIGIVVAVISFLWSCYI